MPRVRGTLGESVVKGTGEILTFDLSKESVFRAESRLFRQAKKFRAENASASAVVFFDRVNESFARAWQGTDTSRWGFPVTSEGVRYVYYVCMRLQQLGNAASQVLFATKGVNEAFYAAPDTADVNSDLVVGLLNGNTTPTVFGATLSGFVTSNATLTLLSDATAGGANGEQVLKTLGQTLNGYAASSDQDVTKNSAGTADTTGNIWVGKPDGTAANERPGGNSQPFPLEPCPWGS